MPLIFLVRGGRQAWRVIEKSIESLLTFYLLDSMVCYIIGKADVQDVQQNALSSY